jgi:hypothetical protein
MLKDHFVRCIELMVSTSVRRRHFPYPHLSQLYGMRPLTRINEHN